MFRFVPLVLAAALAAAAAAPAHAGLDDDPTNPVARCGFVGVLDTSNKLNFVLYGVATAPTAVQLTVRCEMFHAATGTVYLDVARTCQGSACAVEGVTLSRPAAAVTVCTSAFAVYSEGTHDYPRTCATPA